MVTSPIRKRRRKRSDSAETCFRDRRSAFEELAGCVAWNHELLAGVALEQRSGRGVFGRMISPEIHQEGGVETDPSFPAFAFAILGDDRQVKLCVRLGQARETSEASENVLSSVRVRHLGQQTIDDFGEGLAASLQRRESPIDARLKGDRLGAHTCRIACRGGWVKNRVRSTRSTGDGVGSLGELEPTSGLEPLTC